MRTDYHLGHIVNKVTIRLLHLLIIRLSPYPNQPKKQARSHHGYIDFQGVKWRDFEVLRPRFWFINQFKYTSKQEMDGPYSQGASEAAHRDEAFSNLSTKPNISEENESAEPEALVQQSEEVEGKAQNRSEYLSEAERVARHRSQSIDQGSQPSSNQSSALQYPHQSRQLQQPPKQPAGVIVSSSGKTYELKTFGEDWENELKQQEEEREQYHELINTNNQPLLTQKEEHDIQFGNDQMLLTQKEEHMEEGRREVDQLSNEVRFKGNGREIEEVSEHASSQSQKENEVPCQPLFEIIFNDNSQSSLLDFGFKVQGQRRSNGESNRVSQQRSVSQQLEQPSSPVFKEEPMDIVQSNQGEPLGFVQETSQNHSNQESNRGSHQQDINQQSEHSFVPVNEEVPMDIVQYNKEEPMEIVQEISQHRSNSQSNRSSHQQYTNQQPQQPQQPETPVFQKEPMDIVYNNQEESISSVQAISQNRCNDESNRVPLQQNVNQQPEQPESHTCPGKSANIAQETSPPRQSGSSQHIEITVSNCQVQNSTVKNNDIYGITQVRKEDESQVKKYEESQLIKNQNPFREEQQPKDIQKDFKQPLSLQETIEEMTNILSKDLTQQQKAEQGFELLKDHIDLYFLKPLSEIGKSIMRNGKLLISLIEIILLKEKDENQKSTLRRYLILNLVQYVRINMNDFIDYQQIEASRRPHSQQLSNQASIDKRLNDTLNQTDLTVNEVDQSNYAENGSHHNSAIHKSPNYMVDALEEPVKRTVANRNFVTNTETRQSPKSGKVTRRRYKTKTKGKGAKTSAKKSQVQFQIPEENEGPAKFTRSKGRPKSTKKEPAPVIVKKEPDEASKLASQKKQIRRLQDNMMKRSSDKKELGTGYTFIQRQDRRDSGKQLIQVRVSKRLAEKKSHSPHRYSSSRLYEEEPIDLDYIKKHLPQFKIIYEQMDEDYEALSSRDQEILDLLKEYFRLQRQLEEEERSQHRSQEGGDYAEFDEGSTISANEGKSNTMARLEEFRRNIDKYKPSDFSLPISVARVVDPDINNHGIYALLELGRISEFILKAKYALAPITTLTAKLRKQIDLDLATAKSMVGDERDNLAYLQPTPRILELIREQKRKRQQ